MFTKSHKRALLTLLAVVIGMIMIVSVPMQAYAAIDLSPKGKFYTDYASGEEALEAAHELNVEIAAEGDVLLKNDGTLPLGYGSSVSVFGAAQDSMVGANQSVSLTAALKAEGFKVNANLEAYYASVGTTIGTEPSTFSARIESSYKLFNDAAIIILSRTGGEGNDLNTVLEKELEDNKDGDGNDYGWEHKSLGINKDGKECKHYLQITESEEKLISYVKANFKKIAVIINTSNAMELGNLDDDPAINAILWIGRPGSTGIKAAAQILNGEVNPSGRLVDEWYRDFSADPTWQNFGNNQQVGYILADNPAATNFYNYNHDITGAPAGPASGRGSGGTVGGDGYYGIDYDEDVYLGYKYYESVYAEIAAGNLGYDAAKHEVVAKDAEGAVTGAEAAEAWHKFAVVYPFGHGLSYTTFTMDLGAVYYYNDGVKTPLKATEDNTIFNSSVGAPAKAETLYAPVTVTNTGNAAGKKVVEIYVHAPYIAGEIEKPEVVLAGFAKSSELKPGESETVIVSFNVQDFASFDYSDANDNGYRGYELDAGDYKFFAASDSHNYDDYQAMTLSNDALLKIDDFSHNEVKTLFSNGDSFESLRKNLKKGEESFLNVNATDDAEQVLLTRANMTTAKVLGLRPTVAELTLSDEFVKAMIYWRNYVVSDVENYADDGNTYFYSATAPEGHYSWYKTEEELKALTAGWTQALAHEADFSDAPIKLRDMAGVAKDDPKWVEFMNQLTWSDIQTVINSAMRSTKAVNAVDKAASSDPNGPNDYPDGGFRKYWTDGCVVASTWNVELAEKQGIINGNLAMFNNKQGWYGPATNTHRSPFAGRNNEYYSEDGIEAGYICAAVVRGAQSRGINVWIKHMFMNDQEINRSRQCLFTWASEDAIRQIYGKSFQMAMQEGNASGCMIAYNRIGSVVCCVNYNLLQSLCRDEWGFDGVYVSDYYGNNAIQNNSMDLFVRCGGNLPDGTANGNKALSGAFIDSEKGVAFTQTPAAFDATKAYAVGDQVSVTTGSGRNAVTTYYEFTAAHEAGEFNAEECKVITATDFKVSAYSLTQWYYGRKAAMDEFYTAANTLNNKNGINTSAYSAALAVEGTQGTALSGVSVAFENLNGSEATYAVTAGELPAGITLNASTGALSGAPTAAGSASVTVTATVDGWITVTKKVNFTIASAFTISETAGEVGEEFEAIIDSETVTPTKYSTSLKYSVDSGVLPAGLALDGDTISGTPTEAGTFPVVIKIVGQYRSGRTTYTDTYYYEVTLTITGEGIGPVEPETDHGGIVKVEVSSEGLVDTYVITYADGETYTFTVTNGKDGVDGKDGKDGVNGQDGKDGVNGQDGKDGKDGLNGQDGKDGAQGPQGEKGETGAQGVQGEKGEKGDKGDTGAAGATGAQGPQGEKGEKGDKGDKGDPGEAGKGCSGAIGIGAGIIAVITLLGAAVVVRKKED